MDGGLRLLAYGSAAIELRAAQELAFLGISNSARVNLASGAGTLRTGGLSISGNGTLDLANNQLLLATQAAAGESTLSQVEDLVAAGRNASPLWTGHGIISSTCAEAQNADHGLMVAPVSGAGQVQPAGADGFVAIRYAWNGDANLDAEPDDRDSVLFSDVPILA